MTLLDTGLSQRQIAKQLGISRCAVQRNINRYALTQSVADLPKTGRPKKFSPKLERFIMMKCKLNPFINIQQIKNQIMDMETISSSTIHRILKRHGLRTSRAVFKKYLTKKHIKKRLDFVRHYSSFQIEDWKKVIFSDESTIKLNDRRVYYVRRPLKTRFSNNYIIKSRKIPGIKLMLWGAVFGDGRRLLCRCPTRLNSIGYQQILENNLLQIISPLEIYMQDNASIHRSRSTMDFLERHMILYLDDWPPNSPDINIIENMWALLKNKIKTENFNSKDHLYDRVNEIWHNIPERTITNLYESIPRRLSFIKKVKGAHTKY